jgi:hypothetical protein
MNSTVAASFLVVRAAVAAKPGSREREHRTDTFAARVDQMRRDLGNARRMLGRHPFADQNTRRLKVGGKCRLASVHAVWCWRRRGSWPASLRLSRQATMRGLHAHPCSRSCAATIQPSSHSRRRCLSGEDIEVFEMDVHMSALEGSIGILPRRLLVRRSDAFLARAVLRDNELPVSE